MSHDLLIRLPTVRLGAASLGHANFGPRGGGQGPGFARAVNG